MRLYTWVGALRRAGKFQPPGLLLTGRQLPLRRCRALLQVTLTPAVERPREGRSLLGRCWQAESMAATAKAQQPCLGHAERGGPDSRGPADTFNAKLRR
jgi:hypothetical protein